MFSAIVMGGTTVGRTSSFGVDYTKAKVAAGRLLAIIDKKPKIDVDQKGGKQLVSLYLPPPPRLFHGLITAIVVYY